MKKIQALWSMALGAVIGWLVPSCKVEEEIALLYGPAPFVDTTHTVICLYGVRPPEFSPKMDVNEDENVNVNEDENVNVNENEDENLNVEK